MESSGDDGRRADGVGGRQGIVGDGVSGSHSRPLQHAARRVVNVAAYTARRVPGNEHRHSGVSGPLCQ